MVGLLLMVKCHREDVDVAESGKWSQVQVTVGCGCLLLPSLRDVQSYQNLNRVQAHLLKLWGWDRDLEPFLHHGHLHSLGSSFIYAIVNYGNTVYMNRRFT